MTQSAIAKQTSIATYLQSIGIECGKKRKEVIKAFWRNDTNPSVSIDHDRNLWHDFGTGVNGSVIDLVMVAEGVDFITACKKLCNGSFTPFVFTAPIEDRDSRVKIIEVKPITSTALISYMWQERCIPDTVFNRFCQEVVYEVKGRRYFAVGFQTHSGGWQLRNKLFKSCTKCEYSFIDNGKSTLAIFEGFVDMLSYDTLHGKYLNCDYLVVNSVNNIMQAKAISDKYNRIRLFLDRDVAGRSATQWYKENYNACVVEDRSDEYEGYNDLNEYLQSCCKKGALR